jgi:hypothetical protein
VWALHLTRVSFTQRETGSFVAERSRVVGYELGGPDSSKYSGFVAFDKSDTGEAKYDPPYGAWHGAITS